MPLAIVNDAHIVHLMPSLLHNNFDNFDLRILRALAKDGALTNAQLGDLIGLSTSQCSRRRAKLESQGIIEGYRARLNAEAMGLSFQAVARINLHSHSGENAREFAVLMQTKPEVVAAFSVSGDADYVLIIQCENLTNFASFVHEVLLPYENISQVRSEIVLKEIKTMEMI